MATERLTRRRSQRLQPLDKLDRLRLRAWSRPWRRGCLCYLLDGPPCGRVDEVGNEGAAPCRSWPAIAERARLTDNLDDDDLEALGVLERLLAGQQGASLRQIADEVGVGVATIYRDTAGVPDETPSTVRGADGKHYSARRPAEEAR